MRLIDQESSKRVGIGFLLRELTDNSTQLNSDLSYRTATSFPRFRYDWIGEYSLSGPALDDQLTYRDLTFYRHMNTRADPTKPRTTLRLEDPGHTILSIYINISWRSLGATQCSML